MRRSESGRFPPRVKRKANIGKDEQMGKGGKSGGMLRGRWGGLGQFWGVVGFLFSSFWVFFDHFCSFYLGRAHIPIGRKPPISMGFGSLDDADNGYREVAGVELASGKRSRALISQLGTIGARRQVANRKKRHMEGAEIGSIQS